jgi:hypothetical protein
MPAILATQEAKIWSIVVQSQPLANSSVRLYLKKNPPQKRAGEWLRQ